MNRPRLPILTATTSPVSVHQALIHLCQQVPGADVVSTLSLTQEQTSRARLRAFCGFLVKNARISLFNVVCTKVFTFSPSKILTQRNIRNRNAKSSGVQTTKTGGSDPRDAAFSRPQNCVGSLPPLASERPSHAANRHQEQNCESRFQLRLGTRADAEPHRSCIKACMTGPQEGERLHANPESTSQVNS